MSYVFRGTMLPGHLKESLDAYQQTGRPTGGFLQSCIENDLKGAISRADETSLMALPAILGYLYNECDARCWGRSGIFTEWIQRKRAERENVDARK